MDINLDFNRITIDPNNQRHISAQLEGVDKDQVLENFTITDFLRYFSTSDVLDKIGQSECESYFDLIPNNE